MVIAISVCCFWSHIQTKNGDKDNEQLLLGLYSVSQANLNDQDYLQRILRTLVVKEWEENIDHYQGYLTEDLAPVTHAVLQNGHYTRDVGDLMVLTLANVLNIPITVFTSVINMPVLCVMPTTQCVISTQPLFLAFTQTGPGHYDAVIETTRTSNPTAKKRNKCYCGRKPSLTSDSCIYIRCPCFLQKGVHIYVDVNHARMSMEQDLLHPQLGDVYATMNKVSH